MNYIYAWPEATANLSETLAASPDKRWTKPLRFRKIKSFLSMIEERTFSRFEEPYARLPYRQIQARIGKDLATETIRVLLRHGAVSVDPFYSKEGKRTKGYALNGDFSVETPTLAVAPGQYRKSLKDRYPAYAKLVDWMDRISVPDDIEIPNNVHWRTMRALRRLQSGAFMFSVGESRRVTTSVSNLWKPLRKQLKIDGGKAVEVDVRASHPTICLRFYQALLDDGLVSPQEIEDERSRYTEALDSDLYIFLAKAAQKDTGKPYGRKKAKDAWMRAVNGDSIGKSTPVIRAMESNFPLLWERLIQKQQLHKRDPESNPSIAMLLQRAEADLVVKQTCLRAPFPCVSIHDGILVHESNMRTTESRLRTVYQASLGYEPEVEFK